MKSIPFSTNSYTEHTHFTISDEDYDKVKDKKWHVSLRFRKGRPQYYICRTALKLEIDAGSSRRVYLHREIYGLTKGDGKMVDHKNGDWTDNTREMIRVVTNGQNKANSNKAPGCSSKYKGVYWNKRASKWQGQITSNEVSTFLGLFEVEEDAAKTYDIAAIKAFGEFAKTNFSRENYESNSN